MKKRLGIIAVTALAAAVGWIFSQSQNEVDMSDLALANVEALANPEGPTYYNRRIVDRIEFTEFLDIG